MTRFSERSAVSVVVPCHNAAPTLAATLGSVLEQTVPPLEVVVVDDGSLDGSVEIARSFGPPVRVLTQQNAGPAAARNTGIAACRGDYVAFVDADDRWLPQKLELQLAAARRIGQPGLVFCTVRRVHDDGKSELKRWSGAGIRELSYRELWQRNVVTTSAVLLHRSILKPWCRFDPDPLIQGAEDFDLWLRLLDRFPATYVDEPLVLYKVSLLGHNRCDPRRTFAALHLMYDKHAETAGRYGIDAAQLHRRHHQLHRDCGLELFRRNRMAEARTELAKARTLGDVDLAVCCYSCASLLPSGAIHWLRKNIYCRPFASQGFTADRY
jgi:glycosyltransferase involved in cell wall biosynthesis